MEKSIDQQIKALTKLERDLRGINITVATRKDGKVLIKWGKKLDLVQVPSEEWGAILKDEFEAVINRKANTVAEAITHIKARVEQLSIELNLFGNGGDNGSKGAV